MRKEVEFAEPGLCLTSSSVGGRVRDCTVGFLDMVVR